MKTRKTRSKIIKLKDNSGVWVDEFPYIENMFVNDFTTRFKSTQTSPTKVRLDMANLVTSVDNDKLLEPIRNSKIKDFFFQMDKFKAPRFDGFGLAFFSRSLLYC